MIRKMFSPLLRRFRRDREGSVAVEFAFVAAPFFMMVFGIFEAGQVLMVKNQIDFHTDRAVRIAAVNPGGVSDASIQSEIERALTRLNSDQLSVSVQRNPGAGSAPDTVAVTISYFYDPVTPLFVTEGFTLNHRVTVPLIDQSMGS